MALAAFDFARWIDEHAHLLKPPVEKVRPADVNDAFEWYCPQCGHVHPATA